MKNKKRVLCILPFALWVCMAAGCGNPAKGEETATEEIQSIEEANADASQKVEAESEAAQTFQFADLENWQFWFGSGAGAWCTVLDVNPDGTFEGNFHDSDMGSMDETYPNGTVYICSFTGKFTQPVKVNDYTYSMRIESIELADEPDKEEIKDEFRLIYTGPHGMEDAEEILIYLPGAPVKELPKEYREWVGYFDAEDIEGTELPFYGLYNAAAQNGFSSADYSEILSVQPAAKLTDEEMRNSFYEQFYAGLSNEEMEAKIIERSEYFNKSKYAAGILDYLENVRGVLDMAYVVEPLYYTDMKYYSKQDFEGLPQEVIHVAKNEIYARHGYIFGNEDLQNYFLGCVWYEPKVSSAEFDDAVFNDYEKKNLDLLAELDKK